MPSGFIPSGEDRATGVGGLPGSPTPAGTVVTSPSSIFFQELSTSPTLEAGEQGTIVHEFKCDAATGLSIVNSVPRGTILVDTNGLVSRVLTTRFQQGAGNTAFIQMTAEDLAVVPPDEFNVETVEFNPSLFRHPRYATVINYSGTNSQGGAVTGATIIAIIQGAQQLPQVASQAEAQNMLTADLITNSSVLALAQELFTKIQKGFDTFYMAGFRVTWSSYSYLPIELNPGGYIQDPVAAGGLPAYFWSTTQDIGGANIFTALASTVAPQFYSGGISWLRQADYLGFQRTWFKVTRTWIGGVGGTWDSQIYASGT